MDLKNDKVMELPPTEMRFMKENDEQFNQIGLINLNVLLRHGFRSTSTILDIGSGYGRLAYAIKNKFVNYAGGYIGIDILKKQIDWCNYAFNKYSKNFQFYHYNIRNDRYNPNGDKSALTFDFEFEINHFEFIVAFSLFTHMYENELRNYLKEIYKVLTFGGASVMTFFIYNIEDLEAINRRKDGIRLEYCLSENVRCFSKADPLHVIAFEENYLIELISKFGFRIVEIERGNWFKGMSSHYQDIFVLDKH